MAFIFRRLLLQSTFFFFLTFFANGTNPLRELISAQENPFLNTPNESEPPSRNDGTEQAEHDAKILSAKFSIYTLLDKIVSSENEEITYNIIEAHKQFNQLFGYEISRNPDTDTLETTTSSDLPEICDEIIDQFTKLTEHFYDTLLLKSKIDPLNQKTVAAYLDASPLYKEYVISTPRNTSDSNFSNDIITSSDFTSNLSSCGIGCSMRVVHAINLNNSGKTITEDPLSINFHNLARVYNYQWLDGTKPHQRENILLPGDNTIAALSVMSKQIFFSDKVRSPFSYSSYFLYSKNDSKKYLREDPIEILNLSDDQITNDLLDECAVRAVMLSHRLTASAKGDIDIYLQANDILSMILMGNNMNSAINAVPNWTEFDSNHILTPGTKIDRHNGLSQFISANPSSKSKIIIVPVGQNPQVQSNWLLSKDLDLEKSNYYTILITDSNADAEEITVIYYNETLKNTSEKYYDWPNSFEGNSDEECFEQLIDLNCPRTPEI